MIKKLILITVLICCTFPAIAADNALDKVFDEAKKLKDVDITYVERREPGSNRISKRSLVVGWNKSNLIKKILKAIEQDRDIASKYVARGTNRVEIIITLDTDKQKSTYSVSYRKSDMTWTMTANCRYFYDTNKKKKNIRSSIDSFRSDDDEYYFEDLADALPTITRTITRIENGDTVFYYNSHN